MENVQERIKLIEGSIADTVEDYGDFELASLNTTDAYWLIDMVKHYKERNEAKNKTIEHLEKTIKEASKFLIDKSGTADEPKRLTLDEMTELYILLVDSIGFNDGRYFTNSK